MERVIRAPRTHGTVEMYTLWQSACIIEVRGVKGEGKVSRGSLTRRSVETVLISKFFTGNSGDRGVLASSAKNSVKVIGAMVRPTEARPGSVPALATDEDGELHFGCSMLCRTRLFLNGSQRPVLRCSLGYAVRTDEDAQRCLEVEGPGDCWHLTPMKRSST